MEASSESCRRAVRLAPALSREVSRLVGTVLDKEGADLRRVIEVVRAMVPASVIQLLISRLVSQLKSRDPSRRQRAALALAAIGPPAVGQLVMHLFGSKNTPFRVRVIETLGQIGRRARTPVVFALAGALTDQKDEAIRRAAWEALIGLGPACGGNRTCVALNGAEPD
jgi:HEAT repeats